MEPTISSVDRVIRFFAAYAPHSGRPNAEKDVHWQLLDTKTCNLSTDYYIVIIGGNKQRAMGKNIGNEDSQHFLDFTDTHDLVLVNTWYIRQLFHIVFYSWKSKTQIDCIPIKRRHRLIGFPNDPAMVITTK